MQQDTSPMVYVAGFWKRCLAALIDSLCILPILSLLGWGAARAIDLSLPRISLLRIETFLEMFLEGGFAFYGLVFLGVFIILLYGFLFMTLAAATPGMRILHMTVINVYGQPPEWWRMALRSLGFLLSTILLGLGFIWIGFDREKRGLHDWMAGTYVIRGKRY